MSFAERQKVIFATGNAHKVLELESLLAPLHIQLLSFRDATGGAFELEETGKTFEENALLKAQHAAKLTGLPAIGDDSGLEVDALGGAPGLYSARYAGPGAKDTDNNARLLRELAALGAEPPHVARFVCVLAMVWPDGSRAPVCARGVCEGAVVPVELGGAGFGYDPLFVPAGESRRLAQMTESEKNALSHRGRAARALCTELQKP